MYDMYCMYSYVLTSIGMEKKSGAYVLCIFICIALYLCVLTVIDLYWIYGMYCYVLVTGLYLHVFACNDTYCTYW